MNDPAMKAFLVAARCPDEVRMGRLSAFLQKKYGKEIELVFREDPAVTGGFTLEIGQEKYDWTLSGRYRQFQKELAEISFEGDPVTLLRSAAENWHPLALPEEVGEVLTVGDGIATVKGLPRAYYGEILLFADGIRGMVQEVGEEECGCILFSDDDAVSSGDKVYRTGRVAGIPCGEELLGRVIDPLGKALDGKDNPKASAYLPLERPAPGIRDRQPVKTPLQTGILTVDSMFPIGRGQRELIIGDRQTGKTSLALDTVLNQKGKGVICVWVAIGQKASSVASLVRTLRDGGAMDYTVVVSATAGESASLQYLAPYAGCTVGEYFMEKGRDVLIVYDDLSKHAVAYRAQSLLLGRSPGREAYPGDVFYLHSRLLERSSRLADSLGGGSLTALPIVETQSGDVSAYIPTNIISITDGQLFLETGLFYAGQRPAVNVGLSVSRVGGDAQTKAMKKAVGSLRLDLAQYREMEVFTQFSGDLDPAARKKLAKGKRLMRALRQKKESPLSLHTEVLYLIAMGEDVFSAFPPEVIPEKLAALAALAETELAAFCRKVEETGDFSEEDRKEVLALARRVL